MTNENLIVPIYFNQYGNDEIEGTGFIIVREDKAFLITAAHTFLNKDGSRDYSADDQRYSIQLYGKRYILDFKLSQIEPEASGEKKLYADDAIFLIEDANLVEGLEFEKYQLKDDRVTFKWYGYDSNNEKLLNGDRIVVEIFQNTNIQMKGGSLVADNCRMGFGYSQQGFSGGPIINPTTEKAVGMTVRGQDCESIDDNNLNKMQHFIISDYLNRRLAQFIAKLEQQNKTND